MFDSQPGYSILARHTRKISKAGKLATPIKKAAAMSKNSSIVSRENIFQPPYRLFRQLFTDVTSSWNGDEALACNDYHTLPD